MKKLSKKINEYNETRDLRSLVSKQVIHVLYFLITYNCGAQVGIRLNNEND